MTSYVYPQFPQKLHIVGFWVFDEIIFTLEDVSHSVQFMRSFQNTLYIIYLENKVMNNIYTDALMFFQCQIY